MCLCFDQPTLTVQIDSKEKAAQMYKMNIQACLSLLFSSDEKTHQLGTGERIAYATINSALCFIHYN